MFKIPFSFYTGWFIGISLLAYNNPQYIIPNILGTIITYSHQPTEVLNTAQLATAPVLPRIEIARWPSRLAHDNDDS